MLIGKLRHYLEPVLIITLSIFIFLTVYHIYLLQGTARVVNYAGLVRGATQRTVKLELADMPNDRLIEKLDDILGGLQEGNDRYNLVRLEDTEYQSDLEDLSAYWQELKQEISKARNEGYTHTDLIPMSETYFLLADTVVSDAEIYSQKIAARLQILEFCMIVNVVLLLVMLIIYHLKSARLQTQYRKLSSTAYVDLQTGLANKSSCEKKLQNKMTLPKDIGFLMFDMNNLKTVNDSLGHAAGDSMILNFARMLRLSVPEKQFVGRFGGDEFMVILNNSTPADLDKIIVALNERIAVYNKEGDSARISYAVGKAHASSYDEDVTMKVLFEKADYNMYQNKQAVKAKQNKGGNK